MDVDKIRKLNLSDHEIEKFGQAFRDEKFRELFKQYLDEIRDPDNLKLFEDEITKLEREQGHDIEFIKPESAYVIKSSVNGNNKVYINICTSVDIRKFDTGASTQNDIDGVSLSIPYSLSPVQVNRDKANKIYYIYTVVFHPETLYYVSSKKTAEMKNAIRETAFSAIEKYFNVRLDTVNCILLRSKSHKGSLQTTIIRKNGKKRFEGDSFGIADTRRLLTPANCNEYDVEYTEPSYTIKYRNEVDIQNCTYDPYCKMDILVPKYLIVEIKLPLLKSIANTTLDVKPTLIYLVNDRSAKYKLTISLAYEVDADKSNAKFDSNSHILTLQLQVNKKIIDTKSSVNERAGVDDQIEDKLIAEIADNDSDSNSQIERVQQFNNASIPTNTKHKHASNCTALNPNIRYKCPEFFSNYFQNQIAFTMNVKNVCNDSFAYNIFDIMNGFCVTFSTLGCGFFPMYYSFYVQFSKSIIKNSNCLKYTIEDENVFIYIDLIENELPLEYFVGADLHNLEKKYLNEIDAIQLEINNKKEKILDVNFEVTEFNHNQVVIDVKARRTTENDRVGFKKSDNLIEENDEPNKPEHVKRKMKNLNLNIDLTDSSKSGKTSFNDSGSDSQVSANNSITPPDNNLVHDYKKQFSSEDEKHIVSESELIFRYSSSNTDSNHKETNSDIEVLWVKKSRNAKKAQRKKKSTAKKMSDKNCTENVAVVFNNDDDDDVCGAVTEPINIMAPYKYSDMSSRSILKKYSRSFSESSADELWHEEKSRSFSVDDINFASDSYSHSVPKKTVTFNDVISKKLFSSNISILEQRKRTKRRYQRKERKASESDNSETECSNSVATKHENIRVHNQNLLSDNSETEFTSVSESGGETSDDQSDTQDKTRHVQSTPSSRKNHKRRGKKSARKNAFTAKHIVHDY